MIMALCLAAPNFVTITPIYMTVREVDLPDTCREITLAFAAITPPLAMFFDVGFTSPIPIELEEAARLDDRNGWQAFFHVVRPFLAPVPRYCRAPSCSTCGTTSPTRRG